jgi:demethylmenaquinone methyltransferase/2-methoxy-6-polyprenyl-1,4-benzoquinol methylase
VRRESEDDATRSPFRGRDVDALLRDPERKQQLVTPMFDLVAPRYDEFTRRFSLGMDAHWKRALVARVVEAAPRGGRVVDVASGTGDIAFALAAARPDLTISGVDASVRMLALARARRTAVRAPNVEFAAGDLGRLPLGDASVDVVTGGYAIRNAPSWRGAVSELARVLKPGGLLQTLDFFQPAFPPWRAVYLGYLGVAGRAVGWWWHREPMAYGYIARSIAHFTSAGAFARTLEASGFDVTCMDRRLGGGIALHTAVRR